MMGAQKQRDVDYGMLMLGFGFVILAVVVFVRGIVGHGVGDKHLDWHVVPCSISNVMVGRNAEQSEDVRFALRVWYSYAIDGESCVGSAETTFKRLASRKKLLDRYGVGSKHTCRVDPKDSTKSYMELDISGGKSRLVKGMATIVLLIFGLCMMLGAVNMVSKDLMFVIIGLALCVPSGFSLVGLLRSAYASQFYVKVQAEVLYTGIDCDVRPLGRGVGATYYLPIVGYRYAFQGTQYENDVYNYFEEPLGTKQAAADEVAMYSCGDRTFVYVSERKPQDSAMRCPYGKYPLSGCFIRLVGVLAGLAVVYFYGGRKVMPSLGILNAKEAVG